MIEPKPREETAQRVRAAFTETYGNAPAGVWHAPGRANLMGEHTDYNDGLVLPVALPWGVTLALTPTDDDTVEVRSAQYPQEPVTFTPSTLTADPPTVTNWGGYVAGVWWSLRHAGHLPATGAGARVYLDSDVPAGAALSSSAALECATALALAQTFDPTGLAQDRQTMARLAQRAENDFVGAPSGILDQSASLRCQADHALFLDCRSLGARNVTLPLAQAGLRLLVINTKVTHRIADTDGGYAQRRRECEEAARILDVAALRDVSDLDAALEHLTDPVLRRRVRHVVTEIHRVNAAVGLLRANAVADLGALFNASHLSLRDHFEVSCPELDLAVEAACAGGARGARMTGGGFGGSAVALVAHDRIDDVCAAIAAAFADRGWTLPEVGVATPADAARQVL
ncbi:galactokinase [Salinactinospora qingdaonensis]|uniref:Galactokinase n=1 Tax=Salinactinospora qingdaonensis TaxID=702744 RepID=A0ABP7GHT5_9ACTN